jgi:hypothetical protein
MAGSTLETDELSIQVAILEVMRDGGIWTNGELKKRLAAALPWAPSERAASPTRPNEHVWENRINNALAPARSSSLYAKGQVENAGRGCHRITARGVAFVSGEDPTVDDLMADFR